MDQYDDFYNPTPHSGHVILRMTPSTVLYWLKFISHSAILFIEDLQSIF